MFGKSFLQLCAALLLAAILAGCVLKSKAREQARAAFLAGQQQALQQLQVRGGPFVTVVGPVKNTVLPWTGDLTLAKALLAAEYYAPKDPTAIVVRRGAEQIQVDPKRLLQGEDFPLQPRDVIELMD